MAGCGTIQRMVTLLQSNPYVRDARARKRMLADNARQSSIFEGAQLPKDGPSVHGRRSKRAAMASAKKRVSGS